MNLLRVVYHGWYDSRTISEKEDIKKGRFSVFFDIVCCFIKYGTMSSQYLNNQMYALSGADKRAKGEELKKHNREKVQWERDYDRNWRFLNKYTAFGWESSDCKRQRRTNAYIKQYGMGKGCWVQYGVTLICEHHCKGRLDIGKAILFARGCDIDFTGDLHIGEKVMLSENVKILTHDHSLVLGHDTILTPLSIQEGARLGARALVLPGVKEIGRGALVAAGAVVKHPVPPYSIVMGNPAKVVGFRFTPDQAMEYEEDTYPEEKRLNRELLEANYQKYYLDRIDEIRTIIR